MQPDGKLTYTSAFLRISCVFLAFIAVFPLSAALEAKPLQTRQLIKNIKPSIVGVGSFDPIGSPKSRLYGTGFAIQNGKYIATNLHVVRSVQRKDKARLVIFTGQGNSPKILEAQVALQSVEHDLALLTYQGNRIPALKLDTSEKEEGSSVIFTGYPIGAILGLYPATHRGMISSITPIAVPANNVRQLTAAQLRRLKNPYKIYQLDATAYPGNSGSPVFDMTNGKVIGVVNKVFVKQSKEAVLSNPSGITYAIPSARIQELLK